MLTGEAGLELEIPGGPFLTAAWIERFLDETRSTDSDVDLDMSGLLVGIGVRF